MGEYKPKSNFASDHSNITLTYMTEQTPSLVQALALDDRGLTVVMINYQCRGALLN